MESALRVVLILAFTGLVLLAVKYVHENLVEVEIDRLETEVERLHEANDSLRTQNDRYRTLVRGLREDPRVLDRQARDTLGLSRSDELILLFEPSEGNAAESN